MKALHPERNNMVELFLPAAMYKAIYIWIGNNVDCFTQFEQSFLDWFLLQSNKNDPPIFTRYYHDLNLFMSTKITLKLSNVKFDQLCNLSYSLEIETANILFSALAVYLEEKQIFVYSNLIQANNRLPN